MAQQRGFQSNLALGFEPSYGAPATSGVLMRINSCSVAGTRSKNQSQQITGRRDPSEPFDGYLDVGGDVVVAVDAEQIGYLLRGAFGSATVASDGGWYTHSWVVSNAALPSMTLEKRFLDLDTPKYAQNLGCKIAGLSLDLGGDGELTATFSVKGAQEVLSNAAFDASAALVSNATRFKNLQAALTEGGAAAASVKGLSLNVQNDLDEDTHVLGNDGARGSLPEGLMSISGRVTALFENSDLLDKAIASTETSLKATLTNGSRILEIEMQEVVFERSVPGIEGPKGLLVELPFIAFFSDGSNNSAIKVSLTNQIESYG